MPLHDFECQSCGLRQEDIVPAGVDSIACEACGEIAIKIYIHSAPLLTTIIPSYPGCKKKRAGYVHSHGDKPAKKLQSGWGGICKPSA